MKRLLSAAPLLALALVLLFLSSTGKAKADQPINLWLPWEGGTLWTYTQGPHANLNGLDFQPPDASGKPCELFHSSFNVVAAAPGRVYVKPNTIEIDHGNGFYTGYMHVENRAVKTGDTVNAGDRLGTPGCCPDGWGLYGCWSEAPHLHFYTLRDGTSPSIVGLNMGGWRVGDDGCLRRNEQTSCPLQGRIVSNSPRQGQNSPSTPADLALIIDTSRQDDSVPGQSADEVGMALLQASREDDRVSVIEFNSKANVRTDLRAAVSDGALDPKLADAVEEPGAGGRTNLRLGLVTGCAELLSHGNAPTKAAILVSDGRHNVGPMVGAEECLQEAGIPVFSYATGLANSYLLRRIATRTGGEFHRLADIDNLYCEFYRVRTILSGDPPGLCTTFPLKPGEKLSLPFKIPADQDQAVLQIRWRDRRTKDQVRAEGMPVRAEILGPDGRLLKTPTPGINRETEDGSIRYIVSYPKDGEWKLVVAAGDKLPPEGLFITFSAGTIPQAPPYYKLDATPTGTPSVSTGEGPCMVAPSGTPSNTPTPSGSPTETTSPIVSETPIDAATPVESAPPSEPATPVESAAPLATLPPCARPPTTPGEASPLATPGDSPTPEPTSTDGPTPTDTETPTPIETPIDTPPAETPPPDTPTPDPLPGG